MTEMHAQSRAQRKAEHKRLREEVRDRRAFEVTPYGRRRRNRGTFLLAHFLSALIRAAGYVWHRLKGDKPRPAPAPAPAPAAQPRASDLKPAA